MTPSQSAESAAPVKGYGRKFNALKTGWTAETALLPGENRTAYLDLLRGFFLEHLPQGPTEVKLVTAMVKAEWRAMRIESAEAEVIEQHGFASKTYNHWAPYLREARAEFYKALNALMAWRRLTIQQERHDEAALECTISTRARRDETRADIWLEKVRGNAPLDILDDEPALVGLQFGDKTS
jgi:hypothetical protein